MSYTLHPMARGSQKKNLQTCREILNTLPINQPVTHDADAFLRLVIAMHPEAEQKIGVGIDHFEIRKSRWKRGQREFWIIRVDRTSTEFSYISCFRKPTARADLMSACRHAVANDTHAFKASAFQQNGRARCEVTGRLLSWTEAEVDHQPPNTFAVIVDKFLATIMENTDNLIKPSCDGSDITQFSDDHMAQRFAEYHNKLANLRIVEGRVNRRLKAGA